ncbi:MAG TPA: DUF5309 family protein [Phycisphaerae bacterium]|nr:DUF5309 family protein [Phycisphaerae bacterium]
MSFTGKATYDGGATLPEMVEDVSDLVGIISPYETPLLDVLGDAQRAALSTHHEWLEDALLPNRDALAATPSNPLLDMTIEVETPESFRVGDQIKVGTELMLVSDVDTGASTLDVVRGYGSTTAVSLAAGDVIEILGNAGLEGGSADDARFTVRQRRGNWTQIFSKTILVSGSDLAVRHHAVADELDYQKQERLRELLRDLENTVLNGAAPASTPHGSTYVRRTMQGLFASLETNRFEPGEDGFPAGPGLDEAMLNAALRRIWENSAGNVDTIVVNGYQKRLISNFTATAQRYSPEDERVRRVVGVYESDFGVQRVVLSRWVPADTVLLLDSSRVSVLPLSGRSFHYKPLAATGDFEKGELIGEYTVEMRNEGAHGMISGLTVA